MKHNNKVFLFLWLYYSYSFMMIILMAFNINKLYPFLHSKTNYPFKIEIKQKIITGRE